MVGPVLYQEMLYGTRRTNQYVFRWIYAGILILETFVIAVGNLFQSVPQFAADFVSFFITQQLILVVLITPAFVAGAITDEKWRGTLQYLLTADVTSWHVIIGKLLGRITQVLVLALVGLPLLAFIGCLGGMDLLMLAGLLAVTMLPMLAVAAAALLASVWCKRTLDAVIGLYGVAAGFVILIAVVGGPLQYLNPFYVLAPAWSPDWVSSDWSNLDISPFGEMARRLAWSAAGWLLITFLCLGLATWRLRPAYLRQMEGAGRKKARWWRVERAPVGEEPIRWKEQHVEGVAPVAALRYFPRWLAMALIFVVTLGVSAWHLLNNLAPGVRPMDVLALLANPPEFLRRLTQGPAVFGSADVEFNVQGIVAMLLASLVVGIRTSGAVSGEREKNTWEALLMTPLTAKQLIRSKVWGIMGASYVYLIAYAVPALGLAWLGGAGAMFWTVLWLLTTLLAVYFVGAAGIWCSVRAKGSWRSLLTTLLIAYIGGCVIFAMTLPLVAIVALIIALLIMLACEAVDKFAGSSLASTVAPGFGPAYFIAFQVASCIGLVLLFWGLARYFLSDAQKWVADRERTRHWDDDLLHRSRRRSYRPRYYR